MVRDSPQLSKARNHLSLTCRVQRQGGEQPSRATSVPRAGKPSATPMQSSTPAARQGATLASCVAQRAATNSPTYLRNRRSLTAKRKASRQPGRLSPLAEFAKFSPTQVCLAVFECFLNRNRTTPTTTGESIHATPTCGFFPSPAGPRPSQPASFRRRQIRHRGKG